MSTDKDDIAWSEEEEDNGVDEISEEESDINKILDNDSVNIHALQENGKWKTHIMGIEPNFSKFSVSTMKEMLSHLKKKVNSGGHLRTDTDDNGRVINYIVLQGDHGVKLRDYISKRGVKTTRLTGGR